MEIVSNMQQLDAKLAECEAAAQESDSALRRVFSTFRMDFSNEVPADPFSSEYMDFQICLYRKISGKDYSPYNEQSKFNVTMADRRPFPFNSGSCKTVGYFTMGAGFLLNTLDLAPGARVVEFGPGWGNTTIAMAMLGLDVTAVDIESDFCELLELRARRHEVDVKVVNADFMWAENVQDPFDAAIFFECFHHCSDHMRLLNALRTAVKPGGRVYFAAEPIVPDFPIPWGLRMDGESLWAIRRNGWMELGFSECYFQDALARTGWMATKHVLPDLGWAAVWEARRSEGSELADSAVNNIVPASPPTETVPVQPIMPECKDYSASEARLRAELEAVYNSSSWRLTAPLRALKLGLRRSQAERKPGNQA
ncbi:class I SAM-dependent methyltransferase [Mesorhizobium captivum]|uniref:class I SAM-dependent methyltransferase n=1 Tax=Mesorhizobium captivum TaxID=3072319 RepID=UPI002A23D0B4|nr:class I SAM-dependent methyltransferase [Mesorhizobium sp. VK23E]MDX8512384.1 class I SAM-dependent methyltransferase [Mesorhizobium sp. VK23E]